MSDPRVKELIGHALDDNAVDAQTTFADIMLDRIRDVVDMKRAEVAAAFIGGQTPEMEAQAAEIEDKVASSAEDTGNENG